MSIRQNGDAATPRSLIIQPDDRILVTGAAGFIGARVVECLVNLDFRNLVCFARPSSDVAAVDAILKHRAPGVRVEVIRGNLLSRTDCEGACKEAARMYHLAAGNGEKAL